jgi:hypothetical protein
MERIQATGNFTPLTEENLKKALPRNRQGVCHYFLSLIYVRLLIFRIFLECAKTIDGKIQQEHKKQWLLFQIAPWQFLAMDIFHLLVGTVNRSNFGDLTPQIAKERRLVHELIEEDPIFCVLDKAQGLAHKFEDCFRSYHDEKKSKSILHELIRTWQQVIPDLIISGTGALMQKEQDGDTSPSGQLRLNMERRPWTDLGEFTTQEFQHTYLSQYVPPTLLDPFLARRLEYWLGGR